MKISKVTDYAALKKCEFLFNRLNKKLDSYEPYWSIPHSQIVYTVKVSVTFLLNQLDTSSSPVINVQAFLPCIVVITFRINTMKRKCLKQFKSYIKTSGSSAVSKYGVRCAFN